MSKTMLEWITRMDNCLVVHIVLDPLDYPKLDRIDQFIVNEAQKSTTSIADRLLALQTIFFRMEQQFPERFPPTPENA